MFSVKNVRFNHYLKEIRLVYKLSTNTSKCNKESVETYGNNIESRIIYNSVLDGRNLKYGFKQKSIIQNKLGKKDSYLKRAIASQQPIPLILRDFPREGDENCTNKNNDTQNNENKSEENQNIPCKDTQNWMTSYDNYEDTETVSDLNYSDINYGTQDPNCPVSKVPCGGCGALLHCKEKTLPGYIPSEIFKNSNLQGGSNLQAIKCQRCYFLESYNMALKVEITAKDYIKVIQQISKVKYKLVVLIVDLLDFPGSIWQGIADILQNNTPLFLVGNKVDLLPKDNKKYLTHVKNIFLSSCKEHGFSGFDVKYVSLISAKTGYGVEELINMLQKIWKHQGDVYLLGCTNVGKSTLFNTLVHSDYCKYQATDLLQKATISLLPGTTLNLLKFPIFRPNPLRNKLRFERLLKLSKIEAGQREINKELLSETNNLKYAVLSGTVEPTFHKHNYVDESKDGFHVANNSNASGINRLGVNEREPVFANSKWCYDTPGVIQENQIIHLLNTDELALTLPSKIIQPQTFCIRPGTSLLIAGLCKLDYLEGPDSIRLTVFRAKALPITVCKQEDSEELYQSLLKTELLKVPLNDGERLASWPGLEIAKKFSLTGLGPKSSCKDIVFSNSGWIAVTGRHDCEYQFTAWAPRNTGVYLRDCILPKAVNLRGARIRNSVCYKAGKPFIQ